MITLFVGLGGAVALAVLMSLVNLDGWLWTPLFMVVGFVAASLPVNLWVKKRLEALFKEVQAMIEASQESIRRKVNAMQNKMMSSTTGLQRQLEKQQEVAIRQAIAKLDEAKPLKRWNVLVDKQVNTLRGQLYFQIREFEQADACFAKSLAMDPMTVAMKLVRFHKRGEAEQFDKLYAKSVRRFKGDKATILYALKAWVLVKQGKVDDAIQVLLRGKDDTDNEVLKVNWEHLVNGRSRSFSNAGLGDLWYALQLEAPKPVKVKQRRGAMR